MVNPWLELGADGPWIHPADQLYVECFNKELRRRKGSPKREIRMDLPPEPIMGSPLTAHVILLGENPGMPKSEGSAIPQLDPEFQRAILDCLQKPDQPFYPLESKFKKTESYKYWSGRLRLLLEELGYDVVAERLACVEYFPYHSTSFGHSALRLPTQAYTFDRVRRAIKNGAAIVLARGRGLWFGAVPELEQYSRRYDVRSPRTLSVSPTNLEGGKKAFDDLVSALKK